MSKIHLLDDITINKIAAGEVVDRPASIVKELIENSIDAGADSIVVEIKEGGKDFIKISDNGSGIAAIDVQKAFMRHATSKINIVEDLNELYSFGFRGEALASISTVSKLIMNTKISNEMVGTKIVINGGKIILKEPVGINNGTIIEIKDLFFNTPARKKFLKSAHAETLAMNELINKMVISNPNVRFKYINNKKTIFQTNGDGILLNVIRSIYGKDVTENLVNLNYKSPFFKITGYVGTNNIYRGNRKLQHIYINGRYVKNKMMTTVLNTCYKDLIPINKHAICFIFLEIEPSKVDVNIHPNKLEVKLSREKEIENELIDFIRGTLIKQNLIGKYDKTRSNNKLYSNEGIKTYFDFSYKDNFEYKKSDLQTKEQNDKENKKLDVNKLKNTNTKTDINISDTKTDYNIEKFEQIENEKNKPENKIEKSTFFGFDSSEELNSLLSGKEVPTINHKKEKKDFSQIEFKVKEEKNPFKNFKYEGIVFDTYIIFTKKNKMYFMDQHAAHERVQFEKYMEMYKTQKITMQMLLDPIIMEVSFSDMMIIEKNLELFEKYGFLIEIFGKKNISIRSVANLFGQPESKQFIIEIIDSLKNMNNMYDLKYDELAEIACKSAIKANDKIELMEVKSLLKQLGNCDNPFTCPHGRPVMVEMTKDEIEKLFKRK